VLESVEFCGGGFPGAACGIGWGRISSSIPLWLLGFSCCSLCLQVVVGLAAVVGFWLLEALVFALLLLGLLGCL